MFAPPRRDEAHLCSGRESGARRQIFNSCLGSQGHPRASLAQIAHAKCDRDVLPHKSDQAGQYHTNRRCGLTDDSERGKFFGHSGTSAGSPIIRSTPLVCIHQLYEMKRGAMIDKRC